VYDLTSSWLEGRCCELARFGYSRDGQRDKLQIVFGLLCTAEGCPIAVEVFAGDTADPATLAAPVAKLKQRFRLGRVVLVGDRGMITAARIEQDLKPAGLDWITALRAPAVQALAAAGRPVAAAAVRPAGSGRDHLDGLPGRAPGGLQEPRSGRRAAPQAGGPAGGDRAGSGKDRGRHPARARPCVAVRRLPSRSARCWGDARGPSTSR
jgi:hypothetical protein